MDLSQSTDKNRGGGGKKERKFDPDRTYVMCSSFDFFFICDQDDVRTYLRPDERKTNGFLASLLFCRLFFTQRECPTSNHRQRLFLLLKPVISKLVMLQLVRIDRFRRFFFSSLHRSQSRWNACWSRTTPTYFSR